MDFRITRWFCILIVLIFTGPAQAQSYRGLSVVNDQVVWLSGSKGTVVRTKNGGLNWDTLNPKGYSGRDFRDIHAWNDKKALVMSSGDSAVLLYTSDGGKNWEIVLSDNSEGVFWDAFDVKGKNIVLVGDEDSSRNNEIYFSIHKNRFQKANNKLIFYRNINLIFAGSNLKYPNYFAASGSNVILIETNHFISIPVCKGITYFTETEINWRKKFNVEPIKPGYYISLVKCVELPFTKQAASGAYSIASVNKYSFCSVGGTYLKPDFRDSISCYSNDSGNTWHISNTAPGGYRSCVNFYSSELGICTGTNGTDITPDGGLNWYPFSDKGFNVCKFSENYLWLAGNKGSWEKFKLPLKKP